MKIRISDEVKELVPEAALGVINYSLKIEKSSADLLNYFEEVIEAIQNKYETEDIASVPHIYETREAYKVLGKSPSRHRNAAEAMLRRIVKGDGLYKINNVVEINNLISMTTGYSVGSYDLEKISGDVQLQRAPEGETYKGIGKTELNIGNLPVLYDAEGPFGNPTSDSERTMLLEGERGVTSFIYSFHQNKSEITKALEAYQYLLEKYTKAKNIKVEII